MAFVALIFGMAIGFAGGFAAGYYELVERRARRVKMFNEKRALDDTKADLLN